MISSAPSQEQPFQMVYAALWKKSLDSILDRDDALADDDSGQVLRFVSPHRASEAAIGQHELTMEKI